ncbi:MAG: glycosyltransferase [Acidobacteriota bacterium]|nr:glycosyltransferase [Acidobacteriota bacterium]
MSPPEPTRILRIITRLNAGGPSRHVVWLAKGLGGRGYETRLLAGSLAPGEDDLSGFAAENGVEVISIPSLRRDPGLAEDPAAYRAILNEVRRFRPHLIHTHHSKAGFLGRLAGGRVNRELARRRAPRIRTVHTFHGNMISRNLAPWRARILGSAERWISHNRLTDAAVLLSEEQRREMVEEFRFVPAEKVFLVPNSVDLASYQALPERTEFREEIAATQDDLVIGMVGRVAPQKNYEMFVRLARTVAPELPRSIFVVVGGGEGLPDLRRLAAELGVTGRMRFPGVRTDLPRVYAGLDIVALTSRNEGTPLSIIEAMAAGRPIAATDVGGVRDLLTRELRGPVESRRLAVSEEERGFLCERDDESDFARALIRLGRDPALRERLGDAGRRYASAFHGLPRLFDDLDSLYSRLLRKESAVPGNP